MGDQSDVDREAAVSCRRHDGTVSFLSRKSSTALSQGVVSAGFMQKMHANLKENSVNADILVRFKDLCSVIDFQL